MSRSLIRSFSIALAIGAQLFAGCAADDTSNPLPKTAKAAGSKAAVPLALDELPPMRKFGFTLTVTSPVFRNGGKIPAAFSAYGEDASPPLKWSGVPGGTESFLVIVDDPDAAEPKPFIHWTLWNIPADVTELRTGVPGTGQLRELKNAKQGANSRGSVGYFGPKPPPGDGPHRYHFQVFALDALLPLEQGAKKSEIIAAAKAHVLASGEIVGIFEKPSK